MASHVFSQDHFAIVKRLIRKTFCFSNCCDIYVKKENEKCHESTRDHYENAKSHLGYCNIPSDNFCKVCKISIPLRQKDDRHFLTIEQL